MIQIILKNGVKNMFQIFCQKVKLQQRWMTFGALKDYGGVMTKKVYEYPAPKTMEELKERIVNCWNDISSKTLRKMVHQMPLRIKEVLRIKGNKLINFKQSCQCSFCQNNS